MIIWFHFHRPSRRKNSSNQPAGLVFVIPCRHYKLMCIALRPLHKIYAYHFDPWLIFSISELCRGRSFLRSIFLRRHLNWNSKMLIYELWAYSYPVSVVPLKATMHCKGLSRQLWRVYKASCPFTAFLPFHGRIYRLNQSSQRGFYKKGSSGLEKNTLPYQVLFPTEV